MSIVLKTWKSNFCPSLSKNQTYVQGWEVGAGAGWEKKQEPEQLQKKAGAGAARNMPLLYRLLENKKHKEIVHLLLFFW